MSRLLVELLLIEVILLLQFLRQFPNHFIFEFEKLSLFLIVLQKYLAFSKLSWKIVWENINLNFELFGHSILHVLIQLSISMQEAKLIWSSCLRCSCTHIGTSSKISLILELVVSGNLLHEHKDLIDPCDVFLDLSYVMLKYGSLDTL